MEDSRLLAFLADVLNADKVPHGGDTLYRHLLRTHARLQDWGNPAAICRAGLFHSIYGTRYFRHASLPLRQRRLVVSLIGAEAEQLVYLFGVTRRPDALLAQWGRSDMLMEDSNACDKVALTQGELLALLEIEAANLLDQAEIPHPCLPQLARLPLSAGARMALQAWL